MRFQARITPWSNTISTKISALAFFVYTFFINTYRKKKTIDGKSLPGWRNQLDYHPCAFGAVNALRPRQNGCYFPDDIFNCIFLIENVWISIKISLKADPKCPIKNIPSLVQIMAWCRSVDKPLSESIMASLLTHICVTRPQWVNGNTNKWYLHVIRLQLMRAAI